MTQTTMTQTTMTQTTMTQTQTLRRIAVIGLVKMGGGVARNLARHADFDVHVFDLSAEAVARCVDSGATPSESAMAAAEDADLVITSLPMPNHVCDTYAALAPHLAERVIVMDTSTVDPGIARDVAYLVGESRFVSCLLGKVQRKRSLVICPCSSAAPRRRSTFSIRCSTA